MRDAGPVGSADLDVEVDVAAGVETRVHLEDLRERFDVVAFDGQRLSNPLGAECRDAGPLGAAEFAYKNSEVLGIENVLLVVELDTLGIKLEEKTILL